MSRFEVIRGVEGCCLALDDTRIAGPKPWGGGTVIHAWETAKKYKLERTATPKDYVFGCYTHKAGENDEYYGPCCACSECGNLVPMGNYCMDCGARFEVKQ